jgi:hypothetical protein
MAKKPRPPASPTRAGDWRDGHEPPAKPHEFDPSGIMAFFAERLRAREEFFARRAELAARSPLVAAQVAFGTVRDMLDTDPASPDPVFGTAVRDALAAAAGQGDDVARDTLATPARVAVLAVDLLAEARTIAASLFLVPPLPRDDEEATRVAAGDGGPALWWDVALAERFEAIGATGATAAASIRRQAVLRMEAASVPNTPASALWHLWLQQKDEPPRWLGAGLARVLWFDRWRAQVAASLAQDRRPVALTLEGYRAIGRVLEVRGLSDGASGDPVLVNHRDRAVAAFRPVQRLATQVEAGALDCFARKGIRQLASLAAVRFVPWFAGEVQRRQDERLPVEIIGAEGVNAYGAVARALGMDPMKHAGDIRAMFHAMQAAVVRYADGEGGLLMFDYYAGGGRGNPSRLVVTPGRAWLTRDMRDLPDDMHHRALTPLPMLEGYAPPFVGSPNDYAAIARLWLWILARFTQGAEDLARGTGIYLPTETWQQGAGEVGVLRPPPLLAPQVRDRWLNDGPDSPAILERVDRDRYHLHPRFAAERELLEAGGRIRIGARKGGEESAAKRAASRERLANKALQDGSGKGKGRR